MMKGNKRDEEEEEDDDEGEEAEEKRRGHTGEILTPPRNITFDRGLPAM